MIIQKINIKELLNYYKLNAIFVDTREDSAFYGYNIHNVKGHIKGAIQFDYDWIQHINPNKAAKFILDKNINPTKTVILYDTDFKRIIQVYSFFKKYLDFINVCYFTDVEDLYAQNPNIFYRFPGYHYIVSPQWVYELLAEKKNNNTLIFEVYSTLDEKDKDGNEISTIDLYNKEHIPTANLLEINRLEGGQFHSILPFNSVKSYLESLNISKDTTVILYSRSLSSAFRAGFILLWAGIGDVRIMNGGIVNWKNNHLPLESNYNIISHSSNLGLSEPINDYFKIETGNEIYKMQQEDDLKLVSIRSWDEHIGSTSGYESNEILKNKISLGEPKDAIWGFAGNKIRNFEDYYDPDGTLRNPLEIKELWKSQGLFENDNIAFYCGTGWRACLPFFITKILGWENTYLYDGSWIEWKSDPNLPIDVRNNDVHIEKPDAKNDYL